MIPSLIALSYLAACNPPSTSQGHSYFKFAWREMAFQRLLHPLHPKPTQSHAEEQAASAGGKLVLATVGDSPTKASEVAVLTVDSPEQLLSAQPAQWEVLCKSSKVEVSLGCPTMG